jgi:DNA-binding transcriptional ArsR family regulator
MAEQVPNILDLDPRSLRALAHPLRISLLGALREFGPATASGLAARLDESSGATSYHLRQLAAYGLIEEDARRGTARERWWKAVHTGTRVDSLQLMRHPDPAVRGALDVLMHTIATTHAQELNTWMGTMHEWPEAWQHSWELSNFSLRLTPELATELGEKLQAVIEEYRVRGAGDDDETAAAYRVHVHGFPRAGE